jgi:diguanylate cyclase (GGDEF)-like protein
MKGGGLAGVFVLHLLPRVAALLGQPLPRPAHLRRVAAAQQTQRPEQDLVQSFNSGGGVHTQMLRRAGPAAHADKPEGTLASPMHWLCCKPHMALDPTTLMALLCLQLLLLALALPAITGWRSSPGLRWGIASLWLQLLAVIAFWLGKGVIGSLPLALGAVAMTLTYAMAFEAMQCWLGPRPLRRLVWAIPPLMGLALALGPSTPLVWQGLTNLMLALTEATLVLALLWPAPNSSPSSLRWRRVLALPVSVLAALTTARASMLVAAGQPFPTLMSGHWLAVAVLVAGNLTTILAALALLAAWRSEAEKFLLEAAQTDPLTGLANRRQFERQSAALMHNARRHGDQLLALLIDLDHFKQVNDERGHAQGDAALVLMAKTLQKLVRPGDCAARFGGEEFVLLLARTQAEGAIAFDRRLREALASAAAQELGFKLNYSAGWALLRPGDRHIHDLLQRADAALYRAKQEGRGCLRAEPGHDAEDAKGDAPQSG